ncbi:MAG: isocitrate lyase/phosphoenolpyruvate mutase family protein [Solirubrobacteraceae bacterium]
MTRGDDVQTARAAAFRALHEGEPFVIPNPWDAGSAKVLAALGFKALATTSSGFAHTLGRADGAASLDEVIAHARALCAATDLPVSIDLEDGHGPAPGDAALAIARAVDAGAAGGSIEDYDPREGRLYDRVEAAERVAAAVQAASGELVLTARAENHIRGNPDLDDTIARLQAYEAAGADVLYAPGLRSAEAIAAVRAAVGKPLNVLALPGMSLAEVIAAGAQRISVGGGLAWAAVNGMIAAARELRDGTVPAAIAAPPELHDWLGP